MKFSRLSKRCSNHNQQPFHCCFFATGVSEVETLRGRDRTMHWLFNLAYLLAVGVTLPFWLYKSATTGKYRRGMWGKMVGKPPIITDGRPIAWIHAVSVGEVLLLKPLLTRLRVETPGYQWVLSTTTNTGYDVAKEKYPD